MAKQQIYLTAVAYQLVKNGPWATGVASTTSPGMSDINALIGEDGCAITPPDGGSCALYDYHLIPHMGAMHVTVRDA